MVTSQLLNQQEQLQVCQTMVQAAHERSAHSERERECELKTIHLTHRLSLRRCLVRTLRMQGIAALRIHRLLTQYIRARWYFLSCLASSAYVLWHRYELRHQTTPNLHIAPGPPVTPVCVCVCVLVGWRACA